MEQTTELDLARHLDHRSALTEWIAPRTRRHSRTRTERTSITEAVILNGSRCDVTAVRLKSSGRDVDDPGMTAFAGPGIDPASFHVRRLCLAVFDPVRRSDTLEELVTAVSTTGRRPPARLLTTPRT